MKKPDKLVMFTAKTYREPSGDKPCGDCPFRRKSMAGWLGAATPQSFIVEISHENPLPCHPTIDYSDPEWLEKWGRQEIGRICAGALIMSANMCKRPRDPKFPRLPADRELVFSNHLEFIKHHEDALVRSWESADSHELRPVKSTLPVDEEADRVVAQAMRKRKESKMPKKPTKAKPKQESARDEYVASVRLELDSADKLSLEDYIDALEEILSDVEMMLDGARGDLARKQKG